jgi:YHS domain-containing protein
MGRILDVVFDIILFVVVEQVLARAVRRMFGARTIHTGFGSQPQEKKQPLTGEAMRDPLCGMFVSTELAHRLDWHGKTLYFCSKGCLEQYRKSASV